MKVKSCCEKDVQKVEEKKTLTYDEILLEEGVYSTHGILAYIIVIKHPMYPEKHCVLWFNGKQLQPAAVSWQTKRFIKIDKKVCFELV